ncbi:hypothetical protein RT99_06640 [Flavobacterium sp. MEB061]|uniref:hypothetical protein n=1 Tax=Flavobacterium sp. MEB061 TaxID=1587524 RepID=UPI0005AC313A|nr:hypothetical protein [Flavobacterium sp. MEB061]KIQ22764.1 hypothetical protein RT99_06640 [Flavobacterium sp. MEB061]
MREEFNIEYKGRRYNFELDKKDGMIWLIQDDNLKSKTNSGQIIPARNIDEAKETAKLMLYSMGY